MKSIKEKNGQVSVEFFLLFVIVIAIFSIFMFVSIGMQSQVAYLSNYNNALLAAFRIGNAVNTIVANKVNMTIDVPYGYEITAYPGAIVATDSTSNVSASWPIVFVDTNISISSNSTLINISFDNSTVYIRG